MDICAADTNFMYAGTEPGEVYKSTDGGETWSNTSMNENFGSGVKALEIDPTNPAIVFAGSDRGVFRSINGGQTWSHVLVNTDMSVNEILINPANTQLVLAASNKGLYRSADGGATFFQLYSQRSYDVKCNVTDPSIVYLLKHNPQLNICEFLRSTDYGATWAVQNTGWYSSTDPARHDGGGRLAVTPADPNRVYAYLIGEAKANDYGYIGVYRSNDGGTTWTLPSPPAGGPYTTTHRNLAYGNPGWTYHQEFYNCAIMASETNADEILVGGLNIWRSTNGGQTFSAVNGYSGGPLSMHVDNQDFRSHNGTYWIATDGGIYKSNNFFTTQPQFKMHGIHGSDYWGFGSGWNEDVLVGGLYHNGNLAYHQNYNPGHFLSVGGAEAPTGYVNPGNNRKAYFSDIGGRYIPSNITDPVTSFSFGKNPNEAYFAAESSEMEFLPASYNTAFIGNENKIWKTTDGGSSFSLLYEFGTNINNQVKYIEISRSNPQVMYLNQQMQGWANGTLWKTTNGGQTWSALTKPSGNSRRMLLALSPTNHNHLWLAYPDGGNGSKIYRTTDGGQTWINLTTPVLDNETPHSIVHIGGTDGGIYYCTNLTVYYRNNTQPDWQQINTGLPTFFNSNIARPFYRDGKMRIASYGKGIWESPLEETPAAPVAQIMADKLSQTIVCASDSFYFDDFSMLNHSGATWQWSFQNGSPATSALRNPAVKFSGPGTHQVVLKVTDGNGQQSSDTLQVNVTQFALPTVVAETFENGFLPAGFEIQNPDQGATWQHNPAEGGFGNSSASAMFNNFESNAPGQTDDLSFTLNLSNQTSATLTFDVAYAAWGPGNSDSLRVLVSTDCGATYTSVYYKGGTDLATSPFDQTFFVPTPTSWRTDTLNLSAWAGNPQVLVAFRNINGWGNNLYLDNINLGSPVSGSYPAAPAQALSLYPNPASPGACLHVKLPAAEPATATLYDAKGRAVLTQTLSATAASIDLPPTLAPGAYVLNLRTQSQIWNRQLIVR